MTVYFYTSANFAYQDKVLTLASSLKKTHPHSHFTWLVVEPKTLSSRVSQLAKRDIDQVLFAEELEIPNFYAWMFEHDVVEACTAVKGSYLLSAINDLVEKVDNDSDFVVYVDPDLFFVDSIVSNLHALIERDRSILLTPHLLSPPSDMSSVQRNEISTLQHGVFNLGFLAVRPTQEARNFADWWESRLLFNCFDDRLNGVFTDQKWIDLSPAYFSEHILIDRDPGLNFATWNAWERELEELEGRFLVDGVRLKFAHFTSFASGGHFDAIEQLPARHDAFRSLTRVYSEALRDSSPNIEPERWGFGVLKDGTVIDPEWRRTARAHRQLWANANPFQSEKGDPRISPNRVRDLERLVRRFPKFKYSDWEQLRSNLRRTDNVEVMDTEFQVQTFSKALSTRQRITHITHGLGGGLDEAIKIMADACRGEFDSMQIWNQSSKIGGREERGMPTSVFTFGDQDISDVFSAVMNPSNRVTVIHSPIGWRREDLLSLAEKSLRCAVFVHDFSWCLSDWTMAAYRGGEFKEWITTSVNNDIRRFSESLFSKCDKVFCPSKFVVEVYEHLFPGTPFTFLPHFEIPRPEWLPVRADRLKNCELELGVGVVGNHAAHKGGVEVIEIISQISKTNPEIKFHLFGDFPEAWNGFHNCVLHGHVDRPDLVSRLTKYVDIGWVPSLVPETYSFALSDLMNAGLPIIARERGALRERLSGRLMTHRYVKELSAEEFVEVVNDLKDQAVKGDTSSGGEVGEAWQGGSFSSDVLDTTLENYLSMITGDT